MATSVPRRHQVYTHPSLDRVAWRRGDAGWIAARLADPASLLLPVWHGRNAVTGPPDAPSAALFPATAAPWHSTTDEPIFLGRDNGICHFAVDIGDALDEDGQQALGGDVRFADLRAVGPLVSQSDGALLAQARAFTWWHVRHRFCGVCGHPTVSGQAGHQRDCTNPDCRTRHFPRTDPAAIVLVHDGDRALLGRQPEWPKGMHSALAGFVEPGESLEGCVVREVFEESGIEVDDIRYVGSQPWPFPQSLMVGFTARARTTDIRIDNDELEHAGWYGRDFLAAQAGQPIGEGPFALPRRDSIARFLVDRWLAGVV